MQFNLIFRGDIAEGFLLVSVKQDLAKMFKSSVEKMAPLFVGRPVAIKKGLSKGDALRYQKALAAIGAITELVSMDQADGKPAKISPAVVKSTEPLAERLARVKLDSEQKPAAGPLIEVDGEGDMAEAEVGAEYGVELEAQSESLAEPLAGESGGGLSLRPMEGELLDRSERPQQESVVVDISDLSLAAEGELLRPEEKPIAAVAPALKESFELLSLGAEKPISGRGRSVLGDSAQAVAQQSPVQQDLVQENLSRGDSSQGGFVSALDSISLDD